MRRVQTIQALSTPCGMSDGRLRCINLHLFRCTPLLLASASVRFVLEIGSTGISPTSHRLGYDWSSYNYDFRIVSWQRAIVSIQVDITSKLRVLISFVNKMNRKERPTA